MQAEKAQLESMLPYSEDVSGRKTLKETLEFFVSAVEKKYFEPADQYFGLSKQKK